jgi:hypothetical protein
VKTYPNIKPMIDEIYSVVNTDTEQNQQNQQNQRDREEEEEQEQEQDDDDEFIHTERQSQYTHSPSISTRRSPQLRKMPVYFKETKRRRHVITSVLEKILANLGIVAQLEVGDKLDFTPTGYFTIQKPTWYSTASRFIRRVDRWHTYHRLLDLVGTAEGIVDEGSLHDPRVRDSLIGCVHGLTNLKETYIGDITLCTNLKILLQRIQVRYSLEDDEMI